LRVSAPALLDWLNDVNRPEKTNRKAISVYTRDEVAEDDWVTEKERAENERAAEVRPFEAPPASEPAPSPHDSGELPAVVEPTGSEG
jgi:hypothetical protein